MTDKRRDLLYWILGILISGLGLGLCTKADLGLSMIGALPYTLHVALRGALPWFSQGMAEYVWEAVVLIVMCVIVRRFRPRYLLSFGTAVLSGFAIDLWLWILGGNGPYARMPMRITMFLVGICCTAFAIACFFRTKMPILVYELAVTEVAERYGLDKNKTKYCNDLIMLGLAALLSRLLTHAWTGIGPGTVLITFINAPLITLAGRSLDRIEHVLTPNFPA